MPRSAPQPAASPLTAEESRLIRYYVREGATLDRLPIAAKKAKLTVARATQLLRKIHVTEEIIRRRELVIFEQARVDAQDINRREAEEDERERVTLSLIDKELHKLITADPKDMAHGARIKADILKLALVVTGTIRAGNTERVAPLGNSAGQQPAGPDIYQSTLERGQTPAVEAAPIDEDETEAAPAPMPPPESKEPEDGGGSGAPAAPAPPAQPFQVPVGKRR